MSQLELEFHRGARYATVIADPGWQYRDAMRAMKSTGNGAAAKYRVDAVDAIAQFLQDYNIKLATDAHLWCWTTNAFMVEAHRVARAWGFEPKTIVTWIKGRLHGDTLIQHIGQGHYLRNSTEHVVFATRGKAPAQVRNLPTAFVYPARWPGRRHSEKPPIIHEWAERMSVGPRIELFARSRRDGWDAVGDQLEGEGVAR